MTDCSTPREEANALGRPVIPEPILHLILDLDGTLISEPLHSTTAPVARPGLSAFFQWVFQNFATVSIWTAASNQWFQWANRNILLPHMPPTAQFFRVWTQDRCTWILDFDPDSDRPVSQPLKKLSKFCKKHHHGITRHNTVILEDTPSNCMKNHGNMILIKTLTEQEPDLDSELIKMKHWMQTTLLPGYTTTQTVRHWCRQYRYQEQYP